MKYLLFLFILLNSFSNTEYWLNIYGQKVSYQLHHFGNDFGHIGNDFVTSSYWSVGDDISVSAILSTGKSVPYKRNINLVYFSSVRINNVVLHKVGATPLALDTINITNDSIGLTGYYYKSYYHHINLGNRSFRKKDFSASITNRRLFDEDGNFIYGDDTITDDNDGDIENPNENLDTNTITDVTTSKTTEDGKYNEEGEYEEGDTTIDVHVETNVNTDIDLDPVVESIESLKDELVALPYDDGYEEEQEESEKIKNAITNTESPFLVLLDSFKNKEISKTKLGKMQFNVPFVKKSVYFDFNFYNDPRLKGVLLLVNSIIYFGVSIFFIRLIIKDIQTM